MKKFLLTTLTVFSCILGFTQTGFSVFVQDNVIQMDDSEQSRFTKRGYIVNNNNHAIQLKWSKFSQDLPQGTRVVFQDRSSRWNSMAQEGEIRIQALDTAFFDLHYYPNGQKGGGSIDVLVEDVKRKDQNYTLSYKVKDVKLAEHRSGAGGDDDFRVYPNPASDYFSVNEVSHLKEVIVINLVGQEVKRFVASPHSKYDISELTRGLYLIRLVDKKGEVVKTIRLSKR